MHTCCLTDIFGGSAEVMFMESNPAQTVTLTIVKLKKNVSTNVNAFGKACVQNGLTLSIIVDNPVL